MRRYPDDESSEVLSSEEDVERRNRDLDSREEEDDEDGSEESIGEKPKKTVKYISDGLNENDYKMSNVATNNLVRSDCCNKFFTPDGYMHQTKYGLKVIGMITCIHCYISFNSYKFVDCHDMTPQDEECLRYYVNTFVEDHQTMKCTRTGFGGQCILCNAIRGVYPPLIVKDMEIAKANAPEPIDDMSDNPFNNIRIIDRLSNVDGKPVVLVL